MTLPGVPELEFHEEIPSTNGRLLEWAREGAQPFSTVVARAQTQGRGRAGRIWVSEPGAGLWISVLLPPPPGGPPGVSSVVAGVAAALAVEDVAGVEVGLKWPNDLMTRMSPDLPGLGKLGGILCEAVTGTGPGSGQMVAGTGINLRPPPSRRPELQGAAFLEVAAGRSVDPWDLARALIRELRRWADPPPDHLEGELKAAWRRRDLLEGRRVRSEMAPEGIALGPGPHGWLRVADDGGTVHTVRGGTVRVVGEGVPSLFAEDRKG